MILVDDCGITFFKPNAFSPNADGINDVFFPKGDGFDKYHLSIFDRWGNELFASDNPSIAWDGTFEGKPVQSGVYNYKIWVEKQGYDARKYIGQVTVLR